MRFKYSPGRQAVVPPKEINRNEYTAGLKIPRLPVYQLMKRGVDDEGVSHGRMVGAHVEMVDAAVDVTGRPAKRC
jgi:hypothetical protein